MAGMSFSAAMQFASFLAFCLFLCSAPAAGLSQFDPASCNQTNPCCTSADVVTALIGSASKSFCKIEYPVRNEENWDIELVRKKNRAAISKLADLEALGCSHEPCKGWAGTRANKSGADAHGGEFRFETCRETCQDCYSTCKVDTSAQCLGNPSQYEIACSSESNMLIWRVNAEFHKRDTPLLAACNILNDVNYKDAMFIRRCMFPSWRFWPHPRAHPRKSFIFIDYKQSDRRALKQRGLSILKAMRANADAIEKL
ncbi:hypothetical protein GUITHDRAFT_113086 [Guillardia theta CCMP2712]|uniref:ShKT domain-containing protein n=1 Tax=Guillardia theta (strain CCMP2712) TaxID=905079 RepID=L1IY71_GUITC|nr:hypothetical protein GUITHDRAFT_113086 [Guillardia theta CCMP2712]EKX40819.1 hypothetical protein GUITHDRAFT_113086 [Guillardia theta CCMP2712]|eukprot:XP_005827799.1 hypothetical protein GUITHDRAFT_113086 [Guillardia theta CCMP2712]